jgi:hypothetical protein
VVSGTVGVALWIAIAVIAVLVVVALVVGLVRYRRRRISLSSADTDTATPVDRSGGYTASSGITFTKSAPAEPVEHLDTSGCPPSAMMPPFRATRRNARSQTFSYQSRSRSLTPQFKRKRLLRLMSAQ